MGMPEAIKAKWFWYSVCCVLCWGAWALVSKLGTEDISASGMQFIFAFGFIPVAIMALVARRARFERNLKGIVFSLGNGVLAGIGGLALFAAYRTGGNTSVITVVTALYPVITVGLAILVLSERLTRLQVVGLVFAALAMVILAS
jgi:bacterial/archaeal transporter family protein